MFNMAVLSPDVCTGSLPKTVTVAVTALLPAVFTAVSVYVVVADGTTDVVPLEGTGPTPLSILTV
jgi:hypothetical protein